MRIRRNYPGCVGEGFYPSRRYNAANWRAPMRKRMRWGACVFDSASCAGGAEPLPYADLIDFTRSPRDVRGCRCILRNPSVAFGDSIPTLFAPSGHFPLIGGIDPLHKGAFTGAHFGSAYKKAAALRLPLYFTASGSWFYGRRRAGWRTFCCWSRT